MKRIIATLLASGLWAAAALAAFAQEATFEIPPPETTAPALELSGNIDVAYSAMFNKSDSPIYRLSVFGKEAATVTSAYPLGMYLNGDYQNPNAGAHVKTRTVYTNDGTVDFSLIEAYGSFKLFDSSLVSVGKRIYAWGKGYAFNAVGYVNPVKNPEDVDALSPGLLALNYSFTKSIQAGPLDNAAVEFFAIPPDLRTAEETLDIRRTSYALRLYMLFWDTDIDLMGYYDPYEAKHIGLDFSRNILSSLELHGEAGYFIDKERYTIVGASAAADRVDGFSYLIGLRWLSSWNMTAILEYYHDDAGLTADEFADYAAYLKNAADANTSTAVSQALQTRRNYFSSPRLMKDYAYLKVSMPEPFGLVDFSPAVFAIYNINDMSALVGLSAGFKPFTNFELNLSASIPIGEP
ncbi:MAG: hypothetical protein WCT14_08830, partial [Treponemataceae bacterium]